MVGVASAVASSEAARQPWEDLAVGVGLTALAPPTLAAVPGDDNLAAAGDEEEEEAEGGGDENSQGAGERD